MTSRRLRLVPPPEPEGDWSLLWVLGVALVLWGVAAWLLS